MTLDYIKTLEVWWQETDTDPDDPEAIDEHFDLVEDLYEDNPGALAALTEATDYDDLLDKIYDFINLEYKWKVGEIRDAALREEDKELAKFEL